MTQLCAAVPDAARPPSLAPWWREIKPKDDTMTSKPYTGGPATLKTRIHAYRFDVTYPEQAKEWKALKKKLSGDGVRCMESWALSHGDRHYNPELDGREVELETAFLFDNQWNSAPIDGVSEQGLRLFDWAKDANIDGYCASSIMQGYWLEQTPEMREIRRNVHKCGYCGAHEPAAKGYVFCPHCIGSQYLDEASLHMTRMLPVDTDFAQKRAPLTDAERDHLLPLYKEAQIHGMTERDAARIAAQREKIESNYEATCRHARIKRDGLLWLMDHAVKLNNVIYYDHMGHFCFGWRTPVDDTLLAYLLDILTEFPFAYQIKKADGSTLEAD